MRCFYILLSTLILIGCTVNPSKAIIFRQSNSGKECINLSIWKATSKWKFDRNGFSNIVEYYVIFIPRLLQTRTVINAKEITVSKSWWEIKENIVSIIGGEVIVDPTTNQITVSLQTAQGEFSGNGEYPYNIDNIQ